MYPNRARKNFIRPATSRSNSSVALGCSVDTIWGKSIIVTVPVGDTMMLNSLKSQCTRPTWAMRMRMDMHCSKTAPGFVTLLTWHSGRPMTRLISTACREQSIGVGVGNSASFKACTATGGGGRASWLFVKRR